MSVIRAQKHIYYIVLLADHVWVTCNNLIGLLRYLMKIALALYVVYIRPCIAGQKFTKRIFTKMALLL